ncbi:MAG: hypothetical protein ACD_44C00291G0001 [uncultured bacterium]|nr:MAG: hypothetical protein ACD_44C00291G0001 [uncultured bacterium]OGT24923.1 MAG: preprotein translocase subunit SecG [Gammaproteobacteria bacterium RIFCSPHIGHO2_12_38_15]OGT67852.1 MAG: preprotein translocase subunit SecG [Gammaproteobacteria bacterium RIFCSPLOWO2_02_FULL_38_11]OGT77607.1 MAG: preprotein translocase subunit SecG [Gammaproteobacteria bacterium RIFCSPLOWO2_12_FULL_38_14]
MFQVFIILHIFICISLLVLILIQQGKGADAGASFGGASQTLFGAQGSGNFLTKLTSVLAALFFLNCLFLGYLANHQRVNDPLKNIEKVVIEKAVNTEKQDNKIIKE